MQKFLAVFVAVLFALSVIIGVSFVVANANNVTANTSNTVHSCVNTHTGVLSVVSASHKCSSSQYGLSWNKTGPQGPQGLPGVGNNKVEVETRSVNVDLNTPAIATTFELHCNVGNVLVFAGQSSNVDSEHFDAPIKSNVSDADDQFALFTYSKQLDNAILNAVILCVVV